MQPTDNYEFYRWNIEKLGFLWWLHSWKNMSFDSVVWLWYNKDMKLLLKISIYHPHKCIMNKSCLNLPSAKGRRDIVVKWRVYLILLDFGLKPLLLRYAKDKLFYMACFFLSLIASKTLQKKNLLQCTGRLAHSLLSHSFENYN